MDADAWPDQARFHRAEAKVSAALPQTVAAPRLLGYFDNGHWVILVFEYIDGAEPDLRRRPAEAFRAAAALGELARQLTPAPFAAPGDHPRLGGRADLARDGDRRARLPALFPWAARHLRRLVALEAEGLAAARGDSLVHFDANPHNILLARDRVLFADWPHARLGAPFLDLVIFASAAAAARIDPEQIVAQEVAKETVTAGLEPHVIDAVLAAHAGLCAAGALERVPPALQPIVTAKTDLAAAALVWLSRRLRNR